MRTLIKGNLILVVTIIAFILFSINCAEQKEKTSEILKVEGVVSDMSPITLQAPQYVKDSIDCIIAKQPVTIHFSVVEGCYPLPATRT